MKDDKLGPSDMSKYEKLMTDLVCGRIDSGNEHTRPLNHEEHHDGRPTDADDYGQDYEAQAHALGDVDPNELGTFGEVLDHWTRRGGPTADERTRFWMSWTRHTIAWTFAVAGCLIVKSMYGGLVDTIATAVGAVTIVALVWQVVEAVRFVIEGRRWKR